MSDSIPEELVDRVVKECTESLDSFTANFWSWPMDSLSAKAWGYFIHTAIVSAWNKECRATNCVDFHRQWLADRYNVRNALKEAREWAAKGGSFVACKADVVRDLCL
jgi:hypothetical protein